MFGLVFFLLGFAPQLKAEIVATSTSTVSTSTASLISTTTSIDVYGIDITNIISNTRAGVALPFSGGNSLDTVSTPLLSYHTSDGTEMANLSGGAAAYSDDTSHGYVMAVIFLRPENIVKKLINIDSWTSTHISIVNGPNIQTGVGPILVGTKVSFYAMFSIGF